MVLIHWEKSVKQPQKQVSEVSKTTFLPIKLQQSIIQAAMYAASANSLTYWLSIIYITNW